MKKKLLGILLSTAMIICSIPAIAFAEVEEPIVESTPTVEEATPAGEVVEESVKEPAEEVTEELEEKTEEAAEEAPVMALASPKAAPVLEASLKRVVIDNDLEYNGMNQNPAEEHLGDGQFVVYSLNGRLVSGYPEVKDAGLYRVGYTVYQRYGHHGRHVRVIESKTELVKVVPAEVEIITQARKGLIWNGEEQNLLRESKVVFKKTRSEVPDAEIIYTIRKEGKRWVELTTEATETDAGKYTIESNLKNRWNKNYYCKSTPKNTVRIAKADTNIRMVTKDLTYNGNEQPLVQRTVVWNTEGWQVQTRNISKYVTVEYRVYKGREWSSWSTEVPEMKIAGTYTVQARVKDWHNENYGYDIEESKVVINKAKVIIKWEETSLTYNGKYQHPEASLYDINNNRYIKGRVAVKGEQKDAGRYRKEKRVDNRAYVKDIYYFDYINYEILKDKSGEYFGRKCAFVIKKADLTIKADDNQKYFGTDDPELTYTVEGYFGRQKDLRGLHIMAYRVGDEAVDEYDISISYEWRSRTAANLRKNYNINRVDGKFTILRNEYAYVKGAGQTYQLGTDGTVSFEVENSGKNAFALFQDVLVDGNKLVEGKDYNYRAGSVIVDLSPEYVKTLKPGTHTLSVVFEDGKADTTFVIAAAGVQTGDSNDMMPWALVMIASVIALAGVSLKRRNN